MIVVAHLSDPHLGAHDGETVESLVADVSAAAPALTVVTGDWTMRARVSEFELARALLVRLPRPVLTVPGNHDLPLVSPLRLFRPYDRFRTWICDDLEPVARVPGLTAVGLQSMPRWRWKDGRVTRRQVAAVAGAFGAAPRGDLRLVALHHPPFGRRLAGRGPLLRAGADLLLAGHTHIPDVRTVGGTVVVVAGTSASHRTRGVPRSWSRISVDAGMVTVVERFSAGSGWRTGRLISIPLSATAS
ncbi:metallophosphoesterase family protein [Actinoplanes regularis]|uniref:metallophosphoesterase family protein n=1 Tax=Actinoplanes regularis TaxID=52697 RepID=UPI0024A55802|nr:metallophosphoesterase [Actinoplanes regularis]GLW34898.1 metallophosphoesterase [Actinoplanes regularis]